MPVNPPQQSVRALIVRKKGQLVCAGPDLTQTGFLQAWPKTGHKEECFRIYFGDFGSVSHPPASVHSCHSHTRVLCFMMLCAWCCLFTSKSCLGQIIWHSWVPLNLMWPLKAQWEAWAEAVLSALPSPLIVGDRVLCSMGDTSI